MLSVLPYESTQRGLARLLHRAQEQNVRPLRSRLTGRRQVVGAIEEHGVDFLGVDEARDLDRSRVVDLLDRLQVGVLDDLGTSPFATSQPFTSSSRSTSRSCVGHQRFCLIGVRHSRCSAERHVGLPGGGFRRQGHSDRDVDQAEGDGAVPDGAHGASEL